VAATDEQIETALAENQGDKEGALADLTADDVLGEGESTPDGPVTKKN
jgi:hypothetical protein